MTRDKVASRISGLGVCVPERKISNEDVLRLLIDQSKPYLSPKDLLKLTARAEMLLEKAGCGTRYWCGPEQHCTDIARVAAERALENAGIQPEEIDLILFTGMSKAFVEPATAHILRDELGASRANVLDTQDACTSFMKSIEIADSLIRTGRYRTVLIAAGERTFDWADFTCKTVYELDWKFGSMTIGDAAGAMVLTPTQEAVYTENPVHMRFYYRSEPGTYAICHIGLNYRFGHRYRLHSHSSRLIRAGLKVVLSLIADRMQEPEWRSFRFENLFIHDVGKIIDDMVLPAIRKTKVWLPDNYRSFFPAYGNVASASLPLAMWLACKDGRLRPGNRCVFICPAAGVQVGLMIFVY